MTTAIHLCTEADLPRLADLTARARDEAGEDVSPDEMSALLAPLVSGSGQGAAWLFGPSRAPTGYVLITFRMSLADTGLTGLIEDIYVRPAIRRRGIATEVLLALGAALSDGGITALSMEIGPEAPDAAYRLAVRAGLTSRQEVARLTRPLSS